MKPHFALSVFACALLLSGCATDEPLVRKERPLAVTLDATLADADRAAAAGQPEKAITMLKQAAVTYPAEKQPWLTMAQMKFDRASYGEAIVHALEALQRDPNDQLGNSIVAVSGLRLSSKALADLAQQNNLSGSLRTEAQQLARLMRTSLGEDVLVPPPKKPVQAAGKRGVPARPSGAPAPQPVSSDPFGALK